MASLDNIYIAGVLFPTALTPVSLGLTCCSYQYPGCPKDRNRWYKSAHRDGAIASGALWACEDHFDVPNDLEITVMLR